MVNTIDTVALWIDPAIAFLLVILFVMPFRKVARMIGVVDRPDGRKQHEKAIPPVGGLVVFSVFMVYGVVSSVINIHDYWPLFISLIILLVSGAIDDQLPIPARIKFFLHLSAACFVVFIGGIHVGYLGNLFGFGDVGTDFMMYPFTVVAVVLLINAVNLMDGMDGLAGGMSCAMFFWFTVAALAVGWFDVACVLLLLMACVGGFLVFNIRNPLRRKASLFLGDAGSMSLGLVIAWFGITLAQEPHVPIEPIALAWVIGFPIFDICAQFFRRVCHGRDPFSADRGHFHHHFIKAGVPVIYAAPIIICIVFVMGAIGYLGVLMGVPQVVLTIIWGALLLSHMWMSFKQERYVGLIRRIFFTQSNAVDEACVDKG